MSPAASSRVGPFRWFAALWRALTVPRSLSGATRTRASRGGIALLVVVTTMLILTVLVTELSYGASVRLMVATHQRDRAQATWLARSGVNMYRLVLMASKQLESQLKNIPASMIGGEEGQTLNDMLGGDTLWQLIPSLNTGILRMLFTSGGDASDISEEDAAAFQSTGKVSDEVAAESREGGMFSDKNFLDFDGDFSADVTNEERRININRLASHDLTQNIQSDATALQLYGLMTGTENDEFFRERNLDPWDLIANLADWVDADNTGCGPRGGYEDNLYSRLEDPYKAKNALFDTKEEIRLVDGWQDDVYDRFKDDLTVWGSGKIHLPSASQTMVYGLLRANITNRVPSDSELDALYLKMQTEGALFMKGKDFVQYLTNLGYELKPGMASTFTTSSRTFTVTSTGMVNDSAATITAVLDYGSSGSVGGKVLYWRED